MAFTTIAWDGVGVIANCDALADSAGGSWAELGGGGISANTDNYLLPPASIGHVYASKSGFGYYTAPATYDFTPTTGAQDGQFIYIWIQIQSASAFDLLVNNGFSIVVGTDTSNYRTYKIAGSGAGEGKPFEGGGWKLFVIDPTISGSIADTGTFNIATINMVGLWMDTIVSVRADTIFIDQISIGKGLQVTGAGTIQEAIDYCSDYANRAWGVFQKRGSIAFAYGGLTIGDNINATVNTALIDDGNVVEFGFTEFWNGAAWVLTHPADYNKITLEKHASFTTDYSSNNTSLFGSNGAELSISAETGSTLDLSGGQLREMVSLNILAGQVFDNKVVSAIDATSIANTSNGCTWNLCGLITLETGGILSGAIINTSTGAISVTCSDLSQVGNSTISSDGSNHAVEITSIGGGSMNWSASTSGYDVGIAASPVTPTSTGNEDIYVNFTSAVDFTINVAAGATTPSIRVGAGFTGNVNVVAGLVNLVISSNVSLVGAEIAIYDMDTTPPDFGTELAHTESHTLATYTYAGSGGNLIRIQILLAGYEEFSELTTMPSADGSFTAKLEVETNA